MATLPNNITSLPVPPTASDTSTFDARADAFLLALPTMTEQLNSANATTYANVLEAATLATTASTAATNASNAAAAASASASNANASAINLASFEKLYLGSKASDPTLDNSGATLLAGATYYSTTTLRIRAYSGSVWADGITAASGVASINGNTGVVTLKTINSNSIIGSGDLLIVGGLATTPIKTANYTAVVNDMVRVDSTGGVFTVSLPSSPADGDKVGLQDIANMCTTNPVLIAATGGKTVEGDAVGLSANVNGAFVVLMYNATGTNWKLQSTPLQATNAPLSLLANSTTPTLTLTQTGTGNAFVVEDSASTDSTPFVVDGGGSVVSGHTVPLTTVFATFPRFSVAQANTPVIFGNYTADGFGARLDLIKSRSATPNGQTIVQSGDDLGAIYFGGSDGTGVIPSALILAEVDGTPGTNDMPGRLVFSTTADGASSPTGRMRIDSSGNVLAVSATGGLGYGAGAGGTVTQATSKATAVTLNKPTGQITMNGAALAAGAVVSFTVNNSLVTLSDNIVITPVGTFDWSRYDIRPAVGAGTLSVLLTNTSAGSLSEALVFNFAVIKGATS